MLFKGGLHTSDISNCFYFFGGWKEGRACGTANVLDVSKQPHACKSDGSATHRHRGNWVAKVDERHGHDEYAAHAVGDAVGDGGGGGKERER